MSKETLVGTPEPEDNRSPAEKYADHESGIRLDQAGEAARNREFKAAAAAGTEATIDYFRNNAPESEVPEVG